MGCDLATGSNAASSEEHTLEPAIGMKVRERRRWAELTVSDLASEAGIFARMLSKIENGQISHSPAR